MEGNLGADYEPLDRNYATFCVENEPEFAEKPFRERVESLWKRPFGGGARVGDADAWTPPADLDKFFKQIYYYHRHKGFCCIITEWVLEILTFVFIILFSILLFLAIDWKGLMNTKCNLSSMESGSKDECDILNFALHPNPFHPVTPYRCIVMLHLSWILVYLLFLSVSFLFRIQDILDIRNFVNQRMKINDHEMQAMSWSTFLDSVIRHQDVEKICIKKRMTVHDAVMRMMRKENFLIGMLNEGVLRARIPWFLPIPGILCLSNPTNEDKCRCNEAEALTKTLEWTLHWGVLNFMFQKNFLICREFVCQPAFLRKRLKFMALVLLVFSPFLFFFLLSYFLFQNAEKWYKDPSSASFREYSNLAKWKFRQFNEVEHLLDERLNLSCEDGLNYLKQFTSPLLSLIAKFFSFVFGVLAALLLLITLLDESLLESHPLHGGK